MKTQERNSNRYKFVRTKNPKILWNGIPAFIKKYEPENSLFNHVFSSVCLHIVIAIILIFIFDALKIGIVDPLLNKNKVKDIEFIINNPAKYRSKSNSRESSISQSVETPRETLYKEPKAVNQPTRRVRHNSFASIPSAVPSDFSIPMPKIKPLSSGGGLGKRTGYSSGSNSSSDASSSGIGPENGNSNANGSTNGKGFDKNATRKVISSYDISPYVNELKRNIKWNWKPPKNNKTVELFLRIAKDGRIIILNVKRTSEIGEVDESALSAVRKTQPLNPLPSKYSKSYLDVVFTFNPSTSSVGSRY